MANKKRKRVKRNGQLPRHSVKRRSSHHKNEKMGALKYFQVDYETGKLRPLRLCCPSCGPGNFMGIHTFDGEERHHCGKCSTTLRPLPQVEEPAFQSIVAF